MGGVTLPSLEVCKMEDSELEFRRFPPEKQDQVRQLVSYATLLGLDGKDLISIGGKLDRLQLSIEHKKNMALIQPLLGQCKSIKRGEMMIYAHFLLTTPNGNYEFRHDWDSWSIKNRKTRAKRKHPANHNDYQFNRNVKHSVRKQYEILLDIAHGKLLLDF